MRQKIFDKVAALRQVPNPESLGKPLQDELRGLFRLTHGRYRIIYGVAHSPLGPTGALVTVSVVMVGIRKQGDKIDVYEVAQKLKRQGKL